MSRIPLFAVTLVVLMFVASQVVAQSSDAPTHTMRPVIRGRTAAVASITRSGAPRSTSDNRAIAIVPSRNRIVCDKFA